MQKAHLTCIVLLFSTLYLYLVDVGVVGDVKHETSYKSLVRSSSTYGVFNGYIPMFAAWNGRRYPGNLHVFVKAGTMDSSVAVRGFVFFELIDGPLVSHDHGMHQLSLPNMFRNLSMKVVHRRSDLRTPIHISYVPTNGNFSTKNQHAGIPGFFQFSLPLGPVDYRIRVDDATRVIELDYILLSAKKYQVERHNQWITVIHPLEMYPVPLKMQVELAVTHILHHLRVGASGTMWYVRRHQIIHIKENASVQRLVHEGKLHLISWDIFSQPESEGSGFDSVFVNYHAALSYWRENTWLMFIDIDEFLALPRPASAMSNPMHEYMNMRPCWSLLRRTVFHQDSKTGLDSKYTTVFDTENWRRLRALHNASGLGSAVWQLTLQIADRFPKPFLNPDRAIFGFVHEAWELPDQKHLDPGRPMSRDASQLHRCSTLNDTHAYLAHNVNAFALRVPPSEGSIENKEWLWPYH